jgi:ubiquinone/menaquinone biosynthesis C-methylase UbiE|nr:Methyltransferase domain protein [uncultured bacterium]
MAIWTLLIVALALCLMAGAGAVILFERKIRWARDDHSRRPALWERFYSVDWGETTTNNYGFAPATGDHPERFQHQMYRELLERLKTNRTLDKRLKLLEVSCGRGGGLAALVKEAPDEFDVTGLDVAPSAIAFCRRTYGENEHRHFVAGSALSLPFPEAAFDVVLNVEASNDYGDRRQFFREVARVLKPDGIFLYTDSFRSSRVDEVHRDLAEAGFKAEFDDITKNVLEACRLDTPRRREVLRRHAPLAGRLFFRRQLSNYAGLAGSRKYHAFAEGRRSYLMSVVSRK